LNGLSDAFGLLGIGLVLGIRHATDPDHVVAVAAISARSRGPFAATFVGVVWGLGHTLTLFAVGAAIILFNLTVPPRVGLAFELAVALALVLVGTLNLRATAAGGNGPDHDPPLFARRAFGVGLVHGLAGSAAVALLVLATVRDPRLACAYLAIFAVGTLVGMALLTTGLALPLGMAAGRWPALRSWTRVATGTLSLAFGAWLVYRIGWHDGLLRAVPHWRPE